MIDSVTDSVEVIAEDDRWQQVGLTDTAQTATQAVFTQLDLCLSHFEIAVLGCNDARITELNREFRAKSTPTNVLSWPRVDLRPKNPGELPFPPSENAMGGDKTDLGNIAISYDTCKREAAQNDKDFAHHCTHLLVHGCLHLLGFDHQTEADAARMEKCEVDTLARLGVPDPY